MSDIDYSEIDEVLDKAENIIIAWESGMGIVVAISQLKQALITVGVIEEEEE